MAVKPGFQKDGGWIGKNMTNESHAKFHYSKSSPARSKADRKSVV